MTVRSVSVSGLRSYDVFSIELNPEVTLILGPNGSGKTTLLEAIYFLSRGTSFRGRDRDMIGHDSTKADLKSIHADGNERRSRVGIEYGKLTKQFTVSGSPSARLSPKHRLPVVLFEPDELRLLSSSPQRRRDFLDGVIARLSPTYSTVISRYQRTLLQRNELLKQFDLMQQSAWESHLFAWDVKLAELGATITRARMNFLSQSHHRLSELYSKLANGDHVITTRYNTELHTENVDTDGLQQRLLHQLEANRQADGLRGNTSIGPHRDDFELLLNAHPAVETASRGEMRTIMMAFKLLEVELQEHHSGQRPLILLDDVFSELDVTREQALITSLAGYQTVITATDLRDELKANASIISLK